MSTTFELVADEGIPTAVKLVSSVDSDDNPLPFEVVKEYDGDSKDSDADADALVDDDESEGDEVEEILEVAVDAPTADATNPSSIIELMMNECSWI